MSFAHSLAAALSLRSPRMAETHRYSQTHKQQKPLCVLRSATHTHLFWVSPLINIIIIITSSKNNSHTSLATYLPINQLTSQSVSRNTRLLLFVIPSQHLQSKKKHRRIPSAKEKIVVKIAATEEEKNSSRKYQNTTECAQCNRIKKIKNVIITKH